MAATVRTGRRARKAPLEAELKLGEWGAKGATTAQIDGKTVLVDRGIPGESVIADVDRNRKPWRGGVTQVLAASPQRIEPPCPYYLLGCGGCQWQHLDYSAQIDAKRVLVDAELERNGVHHRVDASHTPADPWRYRRTAAIAIGWEAGFRPQRRRGILEIHDCLIAHPAIGRLAAQLNAVLRAGTVPNYHGKLWLDCTVVGRVSRPELQVVLQGIEGLTLENHPELPQVAAVLSNLDAVSSVSFRQRSGEVRPLVGDLMSTIEVGGRPMFLPAGAFFQTNLELLEQVVAGMRHRLAEQPAGRVADIYGGVGTFGLQLATLVEQMTLIELDQQAVAAAERTASDWGLTNVRFISRHAERALPEMASLDLAIVDPPRSGLGQVVVDALADKQVSRVFYVSCSPASLARDLAGFQALGYQVAAIEIFDFYPQTFHVESLAILER